MIQALLTLAVLWVAPAVDPPTAPADKKLDAAAAELRTALAAGPRDKRQAALAGLVALGQPAAIPELQGHYAKASQALREARDELVQKTFAHDRKREMLAIMKVRAERDTSLKDMVDRLTQEAGNLSSEMQILRGRIREKDELCTDLGGATETLFASFPSGALKKANAALWKDAEDNASLGVRTAAVEMLGRVGGKGTPLRLHKIMAGVHRERLEKKKMLPELELKVREFERRYQRELEQNGGRALRGTPEAYNRTKKEPAKVRRELHKLAFLLDAAAEAAGRSLAREEGKDLEKSLRSLVKAQRSTKGDLRLLTLDVFASAGGDAVTGRVREMLADEEEPLVRAEMIDVLARLGDAASAAELIDTHLVDESWHVRSHAAAALAALRSREAVPVLIARLEEDEGRVLSDVQRALQSLTGERIGVNPTLWQRWWKNNGETFEVADEPEDPKGSLSAEEAVGVTFFGIKTESEKVLFVLDISGSMNFAMVPRNNPNDDPGRPYDMPEDGEDSRLDIAKQELIKALGAIGDGGIVNLVLYATDVQTLWDRPVVVDAEIREELLLKVEAMTAVGGTNLFGALQQAFEVAEGRELGDRRKEGVWSDPVVDTVYLLSDGRPSMGVSTDPDEILAFVREENRTAGLTIHTIGLSGAQDAYLLKSLAEQNGGVYVAR
ncbi:MAG: HEAT repeat domain-containing protein [Planctomycetota bacterium]